MAISNGLSTHINNTYADAGVASEMQTALNNASNQASAARIATASTTLQPNTDYRVLLNATTGTPTVTLPTAPVQGQTFAIANHPSNTVAWTLTPGTGDTVDAHAASKMVNAASTPGAVQNLQYVGTTWLPA